MTTLGRVLLASAALLAACSRSAGDGHASGAGSTARTTLPASPGPSTPQAIAAPERLTLQDGTVLIAAGDTITMIRVLQPSGLERDTLMVLVRGDSVLRLRPKPAGAIASPTAFQLRELLRHARIASRLPTSPPGAEPESSHVP